MPSWRCPHCSTPQRESSRCWVCHRSSTSCGTCRHFRGSVAARVGYCGLDRRRQPLRGDEVRACWEDGAIPVPPEPAIPGLLDLLTVRALGEADPADAAAIDPPRSALRGHSPVPRLRTGIAREWVDVEV